MSTEKNNTDIKSFLTIDNDEEKKNEETERLKTLKNLLSAVYRIIQEVVNQIKQLAVFILQKGYVDDYNLLIITKVHFGKTVQIIKLI